MKVKIDRLWEQLKKQVAKDIDAIFGATYKVWVINTESDAHLYAWDNWKKIYPQIDSLLKLVTYQAHIRTFQSFEFENKWLGFGRMKWNEEKNRKWTSKYRTDEFKERRLQFFGTEIWTPDWNHCYNTGETPELFINIYNHSNSDKNQEGIIIAIPKRTVLKDEKLANSIIEKIQGLVPDSTLSIIERYWTQSKGFPNRIEDMNLQELENIIKKTLPNV
jgi:hypothetical protein